MFGFGKDLPVDDRQRRWVNGGIEKLSNVLGRNRMLEARVILPLPEFFPDPYDATQRSLEPLFARVCEYMGYDRRKVVLEVYEDQTAGISKIIAFGRHSSSDPVGIFVHGSGSAGRTIGIRSSLLKDPLSAVATLSHELSHAILLGENLVDSDPEDMEPLTDLCTVFLGFGVFTANAAFRFEQHEDYKSQGWSASRQGYLTEQMFGYSLARFAAERGEHSPRWAGQLSTNVKSYFKQSCKWLSRNGEMGS